MTKKNLFSGNGKALSDFGECLIAHDDLWNTSITHSSITGPTLHLIIMAIDEIDLRLLARDSFSRIVDTDTLGA